MLNFSRLRPTFFLPWLLVLAIPESAPCQEVTRETIAATPDWAGACQSLPKCCRDHVYIFLVNGLDPVIPEEERLRVHAERIGDYTISVCA